jgi:mannose-1-phosphate guanylyltransferase
MARNRRWGAILAGGDGVRLKPLTQFICGDDRPKQFCSLFDKRTLLGETVRRAERSIPAAQILFALTHAHRDFFVEEPEVFDAQRIVQPANKGTAPPILFSLLSIEGLDKDALVAVLPSDHHYSDEPFFTSALEAAFEIAAERPESVVLIGAEPDRPEVEYGWIELGASVGVAGRVGGGAECGQNGSGLYRVGGFLEKPPLDVAQTLSGDRWAWNTFVMVGHVRAFLEIAGRAIPDVVEAVRQAELWTGFETCIEESVYSLVPSTDFSKQVLSPQADRLLVLRVRDLGWSDLGHPGRVLAVLEKKRSRPRWWTRELQKGMAAGAA